MRRTIVIVTLVILLVVMQVSRMERRELSYST